MLEFVGAYLFCDRYVTTQSDTSQYRRPKTKERHREQREIFEAHIRAIDRDRLVAESVQSMGSYFPRTDAKSDTGN